MPTEEPSKTLKQLADNSGKYPVEAFDFVRDGLQYAVNHGKDDLECPICHITGKDLCLGLREIALDRWGMLASTVLRNWNIHATGDFGHIVFAMVETGWMAKTDEDTIDDFKNVYDFNSAFDGGAN